MLSTSEKKLHRQPYLLIALAILVLLLAIATPFRRDIPTFSAGQDSTALSASDVSAYRWQAMAEFYSSQAGVIPVTGENVAALSASDISAYRWQAMAAFYSKQAASNVKYGPPGR